MGSVVVPTADLICVDTNVVIYSVGKHSSLARRDD
jgi:hypothetical protein